MGRPVIDLTGQKFGQLVVISRTANRGSRPHWNCRCDCGKACVVRGSHLKGKGKTTQSCGCLIIERNSTHGGSGTAFYKSYTNMLHRCLNEENAHFHNYGGRGIKVCDRWLDFRNFRDDMLPTWMPGLTIDRIDVNMDYCPENCRWLERRLQNRNKRTNRIIEYRGESMCVSEWVERTGTIEQVIASRLKRGWVVGQALGIEPRVRTTDSGVRQTRK